MLNVKQIFKNSEVAIFEDVHSVIILPASCIIIHNNTDDNVTRQTQFPTNNIDTLTIYRS
jgi:hypothetical protein